MRSFHWWVCGEFRFLSANRQSGQDIDFVGVPYTDGNADHISDGHYQRMPVSVVAILDLNLSASVLREVANVGEGAVDAT